MGGQGSAAVRPSGLRHVGLRQGVYLAAVDQDIVVLDRDRDTYNCLPDAAAVIQLDDRGIAAPAEWIEALLEMGIATESPDARRPALPGWPTRAVDGSGPTTWRARLAVGHAAVAGWRHGPAAPIPDLLKSLPPRPAQARDDRVSAGVVAAFARTSPWLPRQGACLFRSSVLLRALRYSGQNAIWVFGVRTWPFSAHCWLQIDDQVLDDDPERVRLFTPIMAV